MGHVSEGHTLHPIVLLAFGKHWPELEPGLTGLRPPPSDS